MLRTLYEKVFGPSPNRLVVWRGHEILFKVSEDLVGNDEALLPNGDGDAVDILKKCFGDKLPVFTVNPNIENPGWFDKSSVFQVHVLPDTPAPRQDWPYGPEYHWAKPETTGITVEGRQVLYMFAKDVISMNRLRHIQ